MHRLRQLRGVHLSGGDLLQVQHRTRLYLDVLDALEASPIELDDGEAGLRIYLPEPEPLRRPGVEGVRFVLVEVVVVAEGDVVEAALQHPRLQVRLAHLVLARLESWHQPVRHEYVHVRVPRRRHRPRPEHSPVRHQRYPDVGVADIFVDGTRPRSRGQRSRSPGSRTPGPRSSSAGAASRGCPPRPGRGCPGV